MGSVETLIKAVLCNILVCTAVYMSSKEESNAKKIIAVYLPVVIFVLCGFEHSVADMYFLPAAFLADNTSITIPAAIKVILLDTIGNIIGGFITGAYFIIITKTGWKSASGETGEWIVTAHYRSERQGQHQSPV